MQEKFGAVFFGPPCNCIVVVVIARPAAGTRVPDGCYLFIILISACLFIYLIHGESTLQHTVTSQLDNKA